ncbi:KptA family-domain-containing protein [Collybia nuda]|uniref:2'-phosphotransferase n=1 Tax=Collybia nuda TaxID=64659 RepID=A0A9P6CFV1_9AGAR|nr:KptA family-domain-containing protein [Collybia nuda]
MLARGIYCQTRRIISLAARDSLQFNHRHVQISRHDSSHNRFLTWTYIALRGSKRAQESSLWHTMEAQTPRVNETVGASTTNPQGPNKNQRGTGESGQKRQGGGGGGGKQGGAVNQKPGGKLRGLEKDSPEVRLSKTLSWLLRHGAKGEGLAMRADGYVKVTDLLENPKLKSQSLQLTGLQEIVKADAKKRYDLVFEVDPLGSDPAVGAWWIKANQGHSIKTVKLELKPIVALSDIPTGIAVHGTQRKAWESIVTQGLSKMKRNHIHLAQGVAGENVISGMRNSSQILIFIDVQKALDAGIKFFFSDNGVILTEGNNTGFLGPEFFLRVEDAKRMPLPGWEGKTS